MLLLVWCCCNFRTLQDWRNPYYREGRIGNIILSSWFLVWFRYVVCIDVCVCMTSPLMTNLSNTQPPSALLSWPILSSFYLYGWTIHWKSGNRWSKRMCTSGWSDYYQNTVSEWRICDIYTSPHNWFRPTFLGGFLSFPFWSLIVPSWWKSPIDQGIHPVAWARRVEVEQL